jgi:hypothetical protein
MAAFILQSVHWAPTWTTVKRPAVPLWTSLHNGPAMVRQSGVPWSSFTHQKLDVLCTVQRRVHWASSGAHGVQIGTLEKCYYPSGLGSSALHPVKWPWGCGFKPDCNPSTNSTMFLVTGCFSAYDRRSFFVTAEQTVTGGWEKDISSGNCTGLRI